MRRALAVLALAACGTEESVVIVPVIDTPADSNTNVLDQLSSIRLTIENLDGADVVPSQVFARGADIVVGGVAFADNLVMQIDGFNGPTPVGVGRTCAFNVQRADIPTPHIFLSRLGKAADLAFTAGPRIAGTAITTPDQKVLLLGGDNQTIERFDPITYKLELLDSAVATRAGPAYALLGATAPRPAVFGGMVGASPVQTVDVVGFDGRVDQFPDPAGALARPFASAARLPDGDVLVTGGRNLDGTASSAVSIVRLDEARNEVRIDQVSSNLLAAREGHAMTPLGKGSGTKILITGGTNNGAVLAQTEIFDPVTGNLVPNLDPRFDLTVARTGHRALEMPDGSILVVGGIDGTTGINTVEQLSPITGFALATSLPAGAPVIDFTLVTLPDGRGMIVGGRTSPTDTEGLRSIYLINFSEGGQVSVNIAADVLAAGRINPQVAVLCDGTVLISGGTTTSAVVERFNPNEPKIVD